MNRKSIRITFTSQPHSTVLNGDDERLCCIQAENVLRAWMGAGFRVDVAVACRTLDQARRIAEYVADVARELTSEEDVRSAKIESRPGVGAKFLPR